MPLSTARTSRRPRAIAATTLALLAPILLLVWRSNDAPPPAASELGPPEPLAELSIDAPAAISRTPERVAADHVRVRVVGESGEVHLSDFVEVRFSPFPDGAASVHRLPVGREASVDLDEGRYVLSLADAADAAARGVWPDRILIPGPDERRARGEDGILELLVADAVEVDLRTVDADGRSLADVPVMFHRWHDPTVRRTLRTGPEGTARGRLPIGTYRLKIGGIDHSVDGSFDRREVADPVTLGLSGTPVEVVVRAALVERPKLRVEAEVFCEGGPIDPESIRRFEVRWRGMTFHPAPSGGALFVAEREVIGGGDARRPAGVFFAGVGLEEVHAEWDAPAADVDVLRGSITVRRRAGAFDGAYVDERGRPCPDETLRLVLMPGDDATVQEFREVVTDGRGRFRVDGVSFPCVLHVDDRTPGRRIEPHAAAPWRVERGDAVTIVRRPRHRVVASVPDPALAESILRSASSGVVFDVLPVEVPAERNLEAFGDGLKGLHRAALEQLRQQGEIDLGDLAEGRYRITLFVPDRGTWSDEIAVDDSVDVTRFEIVLPTSSRSVRGSLPDLAFERDALAVDGHVSLTAIRSIYENTASGVGEGGRRTAAAWLDEQGEFEITAHSSAQSVITLLVDGARVLRYVKGSVGGPPIPASGDAVLHGRVVDLGGRPLPGLAVNLTSLRGGESAGKISWPLASELLDLRTDAQGRFRITGATPGTYVLSVSRLEIGAHAGDRRFGFSAADLRTVDLLAGPQELVVELTDAEVLAQTPDGCGCPADAHEHP